MNSTEAGGSVSWPLNNIEVILSQHAEEAAFLWHLRQYAVHAPHYKLEHLAELDGRIEGHIDGLRIAGGAGWALCEENLQYEEGGEVFAAAVVALESGNEARIGRVREVVESAPETARGFISALGWLEFSGVRQTVRNLLLSDSPLWRRIGLAACAVHRIDFLNAGFLTRQLEAPDAALRARTLRAIGELGKAELREKILEHLNDDDPACRFWAAWSAVLLGDRQKALERLVIDAQRPSPWQMQAVNLAFRCITGTDTERICTAMFQRPEFRRVALVALGVHGDPAHVPHLFAWMDVPELARVAGEAFSLVTGIDLAYEDLEGEWPPGFEAGPSEDAEDDDVTMDEDEDLPWPDRKRIERWWDEHRSRFPAGVRHLCGVPVSPEQCLRTLQEGYQRQRHAAALELVLERSGGVLFEVRAPSSRQRSRFGSWLGQVPEAPN